MFPYPRFSIPPDAMKGALDTLQRSLIRILEKEGKASGWIVHIADAASGFVVGKLHYLYKVKYERS